MEEQRWEESEKRREEKRRAEQSRAEQRRGEERREEKRREEERRSEKRKSQKKEDPDARKDRKVAKHPVFPMICGSGGWKVGSLKRRVRSQLARCERWKLAHHSGTKHICKSKCTTHLSLGALLEVEMSKKCTRSWREAHFEVEMYKAKQFSHLWKMLKKCTPLWREAHFETTMYKTRHVRPLLEVEMSKKCTPLWREAHFEVNSAKI